MTVRIEPVGGAAAIVDGAVSAGAPVPRPRDWSDFASPRPDGLLGLDLVVEGITCAACLSVIEHGFAGLPGVAKARLNLTNRRLSFEWNPALINAGDLVRRLERLGYRAQPFDPGRRSMEEQAEARELLRATAVAGFASMNVMLLSVAVWAGNVSDIDPVTRDFFHWLSALIALPAAVYAGRPFFRSAWRALKVFRTNMDVPISIGIILTLLLSLWQTMRSAEHAYFDSAVMLLFFLLVGRTLDQSMRRRTRAVAEDLAALKSSSAVKILADGTLREVPLSRIEPGDIVFVRPGERIPVDGIIEAGVSEVDYSLITGETIPVPVAIGDRVYAGTADLMGALTIRVMAAERGTLLDEVNRLLEAASQAKSAAMRLSDEVARRYAPVVHLAALSTFLGWMAMGERSDAALVTAVSVLIITCPCALALAVPAVQVVASGMLFRRGVLIRSGDAIERLAAVDTIVFDKTGTLTLPEPVLLNAVSLDRLAQGLDSGAIPCRSDGPIRSGNALEASGRLAAASSHPLGRALAAAAGNPMPEPSAREVPGRGIEATVDGERERLGSAEFCGLSGTEVDVFRAAYPTASIVYWRRGTQAPVAFGFRQGLRSDAKQTIAALKAEGYRIEILSGDRVDAVSAAAVALDLDVWAAEQSPTEKVARLQTLAGQGRRVLMVGDGLNDAPALAAAHVSLSPITAVHLSQVAADAVFLGDRLAAVAHALAIARRARRAMAENLWISIVYNVVAVPIAVLGMVTPLVAALAMSGSSLVVTVNALRLRLGDATVETSTAETIEIKP